MVLTPYCFVTPDGVCLRLRIQPNAKKTEVIGSYGSSIKLRIHAPPVDGKANAELVRFLSELFQVHKNAIQIKAGDTSQQKTVELVGVTLEKVVQTIAPLL